MSKSSSSDNPPPRRSWLRVLKGAGARRRIEGVQLYLRVLALAVVGLLVWASMAHVDRVVRVNGKIIPAGRSQEIQHLEGGIIAAISTTEGAAVKRGDLLLTIDDAAAGSSLGENKVKLISHRVRAARLAAEAKGEEALIFPADLASTPAGVAEKNLFLSRREKLGQEILVQEGMIRQQNARLAETVKRRASLASELNVARSRTKLLAGMAERNAASKLEVLEAQGHERRFETEISDAETSIPTIKAAIDEANARISTIRADFRSEAQGELVSALAEIDRLNQVLVSANDRVNRTEIRAPIDGIINRISVNTVGGVVKAGESLVELIPYTSEVLIEAKAQPKDRGYLRPGLDATVRISAYDVGEYGVLQSRVTEVSADTVPDAHGDPYYRVNLLVRDIPAAYKNHLMVPGMTATADIVTGNRTVMGLLLSPLRKFTYSIFKDAR